MMESESGLRWLDGTDAGDYAAWCDFWSNSTLRRPHDHPAYLELTGPANSTPSAVVYDVPGSGTVFYAFSWRDLCALPFFNEVREPAFDLVSPYGYGGPLYTGDMASKGDVFQRFESAFVEEIRGRGGISEFLREDLFCDRFDGRTLGERLMQQGNIIVDLGFDPDQRWMRYKHKVRKNVNKALSHDLEVVFDREGERLDDFISIYNATMLRTGASENFIYKKHQCQKLIRELGQNNGLIFVHVLDCGTIVSTELLLMSEDTIYSFLGGAKPDALKKRPNDLLKHEVIRWGGENGYKHYVLGGGASPMDGIYQYKDSFEPGGIYPFYVKKVIYDQDMYDNLVQMRRAFEISNGNRSWSPSKDFFPAYLSL